MGGGGMSKAAGLGEPRRPPWASLSSCGGGATCFPCRRASRWDRLFGTRVHPFTKGWTPPLCDIPAPTSALTRWEAQRGFSAGSGVGGQMGPWRKRLGHDFSDVKQAILGLGHPVI